MIIEICHPDLRESSLQINGCLVHCAASNKFSWDVSEHGEIIIMFQPWKIKPILRIDNFLINHWLGNVLLQDHAISLQFDQNFFARYRAKDLEARLNSLGSKPADITIDRTVGRCLHQDLVDQIKDKLIEKSSFN